MNGVGFLQLQSENAKDDGAQWVHLLPVGKFSGRDGRGPYSVTDPAAIVLASQGYAGSRLIPVDYNHSIDLAAPKGHEAPAAGWVVGLQVRDSGIWGLVEWTPKASLHLAEREYRYLSPAFAHKASGEVTHILRASLVNTPNINELAALASVTEDIMDDTLLRLRVEAAANGAAIIAAVEALQTATHAERQPDPAKFVPIGLLKDAVAEANKLRQGVTLQAATELVDGVIGSGHILPFMRDWAIELCQQNKPSFDTFIGGVGPGFSNLLKKTNTSARSPAAQAKDSSDQDSEIALNMGFEPDAFAEFRAQNRQQEH